MAGRQRQPVFLSTRPGSRQCNQRPASGRTEFEQRNHAQMVTCADATKLRSEYMITVGPDRTCLFSGGPDGSTVWAARSTPSPGEGTLMRFRPVLVSLVASA